MKALIDISDKANRVLMVVKAQYGLKDKSQSIEVITKEYEELVFEPKVKASYLRKLKKIQNEKVVKVSTAEGFARRYGLD